MTREVCEHFNPVDQPCAKCEEKRKSEALFLADELEIPLGTVIQSEVCRRAAKELRRLHAELERCKQVCAATSEAWREEAALAEHYCDTHCTWADHAPMYGARALAKAYENGWNAAKAEPVQEPVAWFHTDFGSLELSRVQRVGWKPLYAAPPQRKEDAMQKFTDVNQELQAVLGCDHCNQPLYAATKCRVCGRVTEPVQDTGVKLKPVFYAPRRLDDAEVEDIIKRNAAISECPNCASLEAQNTELDRKLAEMEAKLNNQSVDDAFRILAEANRRAIDYINHLEAENAKLRKGPV